MIEIPAQGAAYFASDLHLSEDTPLTLAAFERWMASIAREDSLIFLLGDVFEVWYGDDYTDPITERFAKATRAAVDCGATVYFMHGNRDFLMGDSFAEYAGFEILPDPEFLLVNHQILLISHGDPLCTDDLAYQKFRLESRSDRWQRNFLAMPLEQRIAIASAMRKESTQHKAKSEMNIMDVNSGAVQKAFSGHWPDGHYIGKSNAIVHGHTHRSAIHRQASDLAPMRMESQQGELSNGMRIVLPDWDFDHPEKNRHKGGFLSIENNGAFALNVFN